MSETSTWSQLFASHFGTGRRAVVAGDDVWTYDDLAARAAGAADWLDEIGAPVGCPVAALVTSTAHTFALAVGATGSNRPLAPLGPRFTVAELRPCIAALATLGTTVLVAEPEFEPIALAAVDGLEVKVSIRPEFSPSDRTLDWSPALDDIALVMHTSGTSGLPKVVPYQQGRVAHRTRLNGELLAFGSGCIYASASPFHHIAGAGMLFVAMGSGAALYPIPRFTIDTWDEVVAAGVTHALLVPSMVEGLLATGRLVPGALRHLHYGASSIHPDTLTRLMSVLPDVGLAQIYGQTEGSPITCLTTDDHRRIVGGDTHLLSSQGRPAPTVELVIHGADGDGIGEVWARAPHLFRPDDDGWLRTGDLGRVDDEGYLYLVGRKGDVITRGGENVYPDAVEAVLATHPCVREVAVVGIADRHLGERVAAYVVPTDPADPPTADDLRHHARRELAGYKVPEDWHTIDALPRNAAGKVLRRELRTRSETTPT